MADIAIDISDDDADVEVSNPRGFDLRISTPAFLLDLSHEQGQAIYNGLRPFFEDTGAGDGE